MLTLFNTLTGRKEPIQTITPGMAKIYTCGPTVYRFPHIGNMRIYLMADWLRRALECFGFRTLHVKNITDIGHMRQEMLERGEDKVIAAARAAGKTPLEIAQYYTEAFHLDERKLNILPAHDYPRATENIPEMVALIEKLMVKGCAYQSGGNIYFDVKRFSGYGKLSGNKLESLLEGVRGETDPSKRNPEDFTLWKLAEPGREMKWPSPWGEGFPGWHIECSAMSLKYLGERFDIHTGGVDNIFPHHEDEIAQSEAAAGHPVVNHWMHGQHLLADGLKMAKSTGNAYTLSDIEKRGYDPMALRYLCLGVHYRSRLNFTMRSLKAAQVRLFKLRKNAALLAEETGGIAGDGPGCQPWKDEFKRAVADDLALPRTLTIMWRMLSSGLASQEKLWLLWEFDRVLGLDIKGWLYQNGNVPDDILEYLEERQAHREASRFNEADELREMMAATGYEVMDTRSKSLLISNPSLQISMRGGGGKLVSSAAEVESLIQEPDRCEFSVNLLAHDNFPEVKRCLDSVLNWSAGYDVEIIIVQNGSLDETGELLDDLASLNENLRVIHTDHYLGEAAGRNVGLKQSSGKYVVLLDGCTELKGDIFDPIRQILADQKVGVTGARGVVTGNLHDFKDAPGDDVDAMLGYCFAFRRELLKVVGLMDEKFRFYRNLDLDYSFQIRDRGYLLKTAPGLPVEICDRMDWAAMSEDERLRKSKKNFYRFYSKWHHQIDQLKSKS